MLPDLRQDREMPRLIQPALPKDVETAVAFLGNRAQVQILRILSSSGPCTIGSLIENLDMSRPSVNKHLVLLEKAGLVIGEPAAGQRHGRSVKYQVDAGRVHSLAESCLAYILHRD